MQTIVAAFVLGLAASASAQVVSPVPQPSATAADLLSRAARMAADAQRRFAQPPARPSGWLHGSASDALTRPGTSR